MIAPFRANPPQARYWRGMRPGGMGLFLAGVGIGKSKLMQEVACRLALRNPGQRGLIASHVLGHARIEHVPSIIARLKQYGNYKEHIKQDRMIICRNGSKIQYGSADRADTLDGWNVAWALGDEIRYWRADAHDKFMARYRVKKASFPFVGFFTTPEMNWMYDVYGEYEAPNFFMVRGSTRENAHNLREGYFDDLKRRLSPTVFAQYVNGEWAIFEGAVFDKFKEEVHICDLDPGHNHPVHCGIDFGHVAPAVVFFQHFKWCDQHQCGDCIHILHELTPNNCPTRELAPMIRHTYDRYMWRQGTCFIDPAGTGRSQETGFPSIDYLEAEGLECQWTYDVAARHIPNGIEVIRSKIQPVAGTPTLYISNRLRGIGHERGVIKALQRCQYPARASSGIQKNEPIKNEYTHILDALRYAMVNLFPPTSGRILVS